MRRSPRWKPLWCPLAVLALLQVRPSTLFPPVSKTRNGSLVPELSRNTTFPCAGIALAVKTLRPDVEIIAVESETCPSFTAALEAGEPVTVEVSSTLADGLAVPKVGPLAFKVSRLSGSRNRVLGEKKRQAYITMSFRLKILQVARERVDRTLLVNEKEVALAVLRLMEMEKGWSLRDGNHPRCRSKL